MLSKIVLVWLLFTSWIMEKSPYLRIFNYVFIVPEFYYCYFLSYALIICLFPQLDENICNQYIIFYICLSILYTHIPEYANTFFPLFMFWQIRFNYNFYYDPENMQFICLMTPICLVGYLIYIFTNAKIAYMNKTDFECSQCFGTKTIQYDKMSYCIECYVENIYFDVCGDAKIAKDNSLFATTHHLIYSRYVPKIPFMLS